MRDSVPESAPPAALESATNRAVFPFRAVSTPPHIPTRLFATLHPTMQGRCLMQVRFKTIGDPKNPEGLLVTYETGGSLVPRCQSTRGHLPKPILNGAPILINNRSGVDKLGQNILPSKPPCYRITAGCESVASLRGHRCI